MDRETYTNNNSESDDQGADSNDDNTRPDSSHENNSNSNNDDGNVENWNESKVHEWLKSKKIHSTIIQNLIPCNGKLLTQFYSMLNNAPEFFYKSISSDHHQYSQQQQQQQSSSVDVNKKALAGLHTRDVALFSYELKNLFKN